MTSPTKPGRGGARKGAGRPAPETGAKQLITLRLAPDVVKQLKEMPSAERTKLIERLVRDDSSPMAVATKRLKKAVDDALGGDNSAQTERAVAFLSAPPPPDASALIEALRKALP